MAIEHNADIITSEQIADTETDENIADAVTCEIAENMTDTVAVENTAVKATGRALLAR